MSKEQLLFIRTCLQADFSTKKEIWIWILWIAEFDDGTEVKTLMFKKEEKLFQKKGWNPGFLEVDSYLNEIEQGAKVVHSSKKPDSSLRKALRGHFSVTGHNLVVISVVVLFLPLSDIRSPDDLLFYTARYLHRWNKNSPYKNTLKCVFSLLFFC